VNGNTYYNVGWDENKPYISRVSFNNGILTIAGVLNDNTNGSTPYTIDANGVLYLTYVNQSGKIVCGGNSQYIRIHGYENGVFNNAELTFYNLVDAQNYASLMSGDVPPCKVPQ
jgi:hypothetical protein